MKEEELRDILFYYGEKPTRKLQEEENNEKVFSIIRTIRESKSNAEME